VAVYPQRGLHGHVVRAVGRRIVDGTLRPGAQLDVEALEREFSVSRTVVREALKVLAAKGLVDAKPRLGTFVRARADWSLLDPDLVLWRYEAGVDGQFLDNLAEVRAIVEPAGARLAALRRNEDDLAALKAALERMASSGRDWDAVMAADIAFHRVLLGSAHNELLERMEVVIAAGLQTRDRRGSERTEADEPQVDPECIPAHEAVFEAVRAREPERAELAMQALLEQASRRSLTRQSG
jgi:GntR family transcriptional regulator, galactonate operon transcriptional repressor